MERVAIVVNSFRPLTIITKRSILDVAAALDPPLNSTHLFYGEALLTMVFLQGECRRQILG